MTFTSVLHCCSFIPPCNPLPSLAAKFPVYFLEAFTFVDYFFPWWVRWLRICLQCRRPRFDPWIRKIPWRREWQSSPVFLPGESHGQRSLVGYSPWGHKELDRAEWLTRSVRTRSDRQRAWWTMDLGSWHCTGDRDQDHPHGKEMQKGKMVVWGALTNSCEMKRS